MAKERPIQWFSFILGLFVADLIHALFLFTQQRTLSFGQTTIQPGFFLTIAAIDVLVIALILRFAHHA